MKTGKRVLSILLAAVLLVGVVPFGVFAQETPQIEDQTDYEVSGTNSVGRMLANALNEEATNPNESYYISNLTVSESTATVTYHADDDAQLVVAVYDEDTGRMLCSGTNAALATETQASVELPDLTAENMVIKAFMLDADHNALCKNYTCNTFTKAYKAFIDKDIYDFDAEQVINLDEATDNNFLVLADGAICTTQNGAVNELLSADYENETYTFANADADITGLKTGDLFYYGSDDMETVVVVKVSAVSVDKNGTATLTGETVELEEAFQHVRIDTTADGQDFELDESTVGEGVTYVDDENTGVQKAPKKAGDLNNKTTLTKEFKLDKKYPNGYNPGEDDGTAGFYITGSGKLNIEAKIKMYISNDVKEIFFALTPELSLNFSIEAKADLIEFELGTFFVRPIAGAYVSITPTIVLKPSVKVSTAIKVTTTVGFGFDLQNGFVNKCEKPSIVFDGIKIEGKIFVGLDLQPHAHLISEKLAEVDMTGELGFEVKASTDWFEKTWLKENEVHLCTNCIGGDVKLKFNIGIDLTFLEGTKLESKFHHDFLNLTFDICTFYWSITFGDHGLGECPFKVELDDSNEFNGHYYRVFDESMSWTDAKVYCESLGGHLATVTSADENRFIYNLIKSAPTEHFWLGGTDEETEGIWKWVTGEEWVFSNWRKNSLENQPDNCRGIEHYLHLRDLDGGWNDLDNFGKNGGEQLKISFVCEWESNPVKPKSPTKAPQKASIEKAAAETLVTGLTAMRTDAYCGKEYVLLVVKDTTKTEALAADNLLYIDQKTAKGSTISFDFVPREAVNDFTATIYGISHVHAYTSAVTTAPTCKTPGEETFTCTCGSSYTKEVAIDPDAHNWVLGKTVLETCTTDGYTPWVCTRCGKENPTDLVPALGHSWNDGEVTTAPTCSTFGVMTYTCKRAGCGATTTKELGKDPNAHVLKITVYAPTCVDEGYTAHMCTLCRYGYCDSTVAALGHTDKDGDGKCDRCKTTLEKAQTPTENDAKQGGEQEENAPKLNFFQRVIQWFKNLFAKLFGRSK